MSEYRWQWVKPDKPGVWAWGGRTPCRMHDVIELFCLGENARDEGWWCFLMDLPEIHQPKRKTVWRMWVVPYCQAITDPSCFVPVWMPEGVPPVNNGAIRTDKTEEREE